MEELCAEELIHLFKGKMWKDVERYPPGNESISHLGKRKIIDSKVPAGRGYVSSQEGIDFGKDVGIQLFWERFVYFG